MLYYPQICLVFKSSHLGITPFTKLNMYLTKVILINHNKLMTLDIPVLETMNFGDWSLNGNDDEDRKSILLFPYNYKNRVVMRSMS